MKHKRFLQLYSSLFIIFCFSQFIIGMELVPAIYCSINKNNINRQINNINLSQCFYLAEERCIVYELIDQEKKIHFLFSLADAHQLIQQPNDQRIQIKDRNENKFYNATFTITQDDKVLIQTAYENFQKKAPSEGKIEETYTQKNIKYKQLDLVTTKKINKTEYILKNSEDSSSIVLNKNSIITLRKVISNLTWQNANSTEQTILFTLQKDQSSNHIIVELPINTTTINKFPIQKKNMNTDLQIQKQQSKETVHIEHFIPIKQEIDLLSKKTIDFSLYKNLRNTILKEIKILDPNSINNLIFYTVKNTTENNDLSPQSTEYTTQSQSDLIDQLKKNTKLSDFFKDINTYVDPDKNNKNDAKQTVWSNTLLELNNNLHLKKLIDNASQHLTDPQLHNNSQKQLNKVILQQIKILDPNYINNLNFYTVKNTTENNDLSHQSTEYTTQIQSDLINQLTENTKLSDFFKDINIYVHPDKNDKNNAKQTVWSNTLLDLNEYLHQQNKRFEENKEFIKFTFLSHALPYAIHEVGTLAKTLIFAISSKKQKNEITQLKNKIQKTKNDLLKTKNDLLKTKNNLLKAKNKVNKYLQKPLTPDEFHKLGQSLERYL